MPPLTLHREPAPALPVEVAWRSLRSAFPPRAFHGLWLPGDPHEPRWAFVGEALRIESNGEARFEALRHEALGLSSTERSEEPAPRCFGGFAFRTAPASATHRPDLRFVLPAAAYVRDRTGCWLLCAGEETSHALPLLRKALNTATSPARVGSLPHPGGRLRLEPEARWVRRLRDALATLRTGRLRKLVTGRWALARLRQAPDPWSVLRRLPEGPGTTRFLLGRARRWLAGASPERLLALRHDVLRLDALAGTADPEGHFGEKDEEEHEEVVRLVRADLAALGLELRRGERRVTQRGPLRHLWSPLQAHLPFTRAPWLPRLLQTLHPTAATCGAPREAAMRWIAEREPDRGWMAGAVGWLDARGDAELSVVLRSVWTAGRRARWWSGAGLLATSDEGAEHGEVLRKLSVSARALGLLSEETS